MALDNLKTIWDGHLFGTGRHSYGERKSCVIGPPLMAQPEGKVSRLRYRYYG